MEQITKKQIENLLKQGFSLEMIAMEFGLDIQRNIQSNIYDGKMQVMRTKYNNIFFARHSSTKTKRREISEDEKLKIDEAIENMQGILDEIRKSSGKESKKRLAFKLMDSIRSININLASFEQLEEIVNIVYADELDNLEVMPSERINFYIEKRRTAVIGRLAAVISERTREVDNIEELKILQSKITPKMKKLNTLFVHGIEQSISSKIDRIQEQGSVANNISMDIEKCIIDLTEGILDIEVARKLIEVEAKRRVASSTKQGIFKLTEEREVNQILHQIRMTIRDNTEKYAVQNPEATMVQMHELCGGQKAVTFKAIVENLIANSNYEKAKNFCDQLSSEGCDEQLKKAIIASRDKISQAEIAAYVLAGIRTPGTPKEESAYFETLSKGLKKGNIKLSDIYLGTSKDGRVKITLADIWPEREKEDRIR